MLMFFKQKTHIYCKKYDGFVRGVSSIILQKYNDAMEQELTEVYMSFPIIHPDESIQ